MLNIPGTPADHAHRTIAKHCEAVGIDPPAGVTYALEVDQALITASTPDPEGDLRAAIKRGEDPKKLAANLTKAAASIAAADRIAQARQGVGRDLDMYARQALHDNAAAVLEQLRPTFDRTVAAAREAVDVIGPEHPGSDILARPAMKALWNEVVAARQHLGAIRAVRTDLADCNYGPPSEDPSWYLTTAADLEDAPANLWDLIVSGRPVRLNTLGEITAVTAERDRIAVDLAARREARKARERENDPMVRAFRQADEMARQAAQLRAGSSGPQDAA